MWTLTPCSRTSSVNGSISSGAANSWIALTIQTIGAGEALGWSWLFPPHRWHFTARSHAATEAVAFAAPVLLHYAEANHSFGYELSMLVGQVMFQRLQATRAKLVDFYAAIKDD